MYKLGIVCAAFLGLAGCGDDTADTAGGSPARTEFSDDTDALMKKMQKGEDYNPDDYYKSGDSSDPDLSSEQKDRYDALPTDAQKEIDKRMEEYDAACSESSEC